MTNKPAVWSVCGQCGQLVFRLSTMSTNAGKKAGKQKAWERIVDNVDNLDSSFKSLAYNICNTLFYKNTNLLYIQ
jgi:hypothetical protein